VASPGKYPRNLNARAAGQMVPVRSHAERIVVLLGEEIVAEHERQFKRDKVIYSPWHYLPILLRKPARSNETSKFPT
jgi:hypothetical protein